MSLTFSRRPQKVSYFLLNTLRGLIFLIDDFKVSYFQQVALRGLSLSKDDLKNSPIFYFKKRTSRCRSLSAGGPKRTHIFY